MRISDWSSDVCSSDLNDPGIHVPFIAAWPGRVPAGRATDAMISLTDLLPTVLDAAGAPSPQGIDGKSFLPVLTGDRDSFRDLVFASHTGAKNFNRSLMRAIRTDRWKRKIGRASCRARGCKYVSIEGVAGS